MNEEQIKAIILKYMNEKGLSREKAFQKFCTAQWKAIIEWEEHLDSLVERYGDPLPARWASVVSSVTNAIVEERGIIKLAQTIEASEWQT